MNRPEALESGLENRSRHAPVVIILAINDQRLELVSGGGVLDVERKRHEERQAAQPIHLGQIEFHMAILGRGATIVNGAVRRCQPHHSDNPSFCARLLRLFPWTGAVGLI